MGEIEDILEKDSLKGMIDTTINDIENIESMIIVCIRKDGSLHWRSNCSRSQGLGMLEIVRHDFLWVDD